MSTEENEPNATDVPTDTAAWQRRLLPFMSGALVVLAPVFFALSMVDVFEMRAFVKDENGPSIRSQITELLQSGSPGGAAVNEGSRVEQALVILEATSLERRYRATSALLMSRILSRQLAFMTGMVLAFIGAVFILGKLSERQTTTGLSADRWKVAISSSSPGLILAFFGTVLIGLAIVIQTPISMQDRPVYLTTMALVPRAASPTATGVEEPTAGPLVPPGLLPAPDRKK